MPSIVDLDQKPQNVSPGIAARIFGINWARTVGQ